VPGRQVQIPSPLSVEVLRRSPIACPLLHSPLETSARAASPATQLDRHMPSGLHTLVLPADRPNLPVRSLGEDGGTQGPTSDGSESIQDDSLSHPLLHPTSGRPRVQRLIASLTRARKSVHPPWSNAHYAHFATTFGLETRTLYVALGKKRN